MRVVKMMRMNSMVILRLVVRMMEMMEINLMVISPTILSTQSPKVGFDFPIFFF